MGGKRFLVVRLGDGSTMRMPRRFTNADGADGQGPPQPGCADAVFTVEAIRELMVVVNALQSDD
jgi:hypothetical protein